MQLAGETLHITRVCRRRSVRERGGQVLSAAGEMGCAQPEEPRERVTPGWLT